ncbi:MAG: 2-hydroxyacid dehydrogenase [Bacteroidota bacterium]|nr:2-hydroxyacid dehydrogenase [Bacteroidota bacterium]MDP3147322.1 2-hydroxyacid dehydrogenase [Bacteroidota bacterium]
MKVAIYSTHKFERAYLEEVFSGKHDVKYISSPLTIETASLAEGNEVVSVFVSDNASAPVLQILSKAGVKFLALRSAGYNHVDLAEAKRLNIKVARVPEYSPYAVAEHAVALMLGLNRKLIRAHNRVMEQNFSLDGLVGFDMHGKTVGIIGTGKIGSVVARIMHGFGCRILVHDKIENDELKNKYGAIYTDCETLCRESDIITLHIPLTLETKYLIDKNCISKMKRGVMLINTSRGALVNTKEVIEALKAGQIGYLGIDVYEEESGLFFEDRSEEILQDDMIARLMTFNNVLITSHQAFLTDTALKNIAETTLYNLDCFEKAISNKNEI